MTTVTKTSPGNDYPKDVEAEVADFTDESSIGSHQERGHMPSETPSISSNSSAQKHVSELKATEKLVGQLLPVLENKGGEIIDGRHRLEANPSWKKVVLDLDALQSHIARLVANAARRPAEPSDYDELAEYLRKTEPGDKPYNVKSGRSIAERINDLTGIPERTVRHNLSDKYKQPQKKVASVATFSNARRPKPTIAGNQFLETVVKWSSVPEQIHRLPAAKIVKIVRDMPVNDQKRFRSHAKNVIDEAEKLKQVLRKLQ